MRDRRFCYPLTIADMTSRYLLACRAHPSRATHYARKTFERIFRDYGLPKVILTDNGTPFATAGIGRLSRLSVWWIRLGIQHVLTQPGHPEQNARHERMHRTLKTEATSPAKANYPAQQRCFNRFRRVYNEQRPHEGLELETPSSCYRSSPRPYPAKLPALDYPSHFQVRKVCDGGIFFWNDRKVFLGTALQGEYVGLEETDNGVWSLYFGSMLLTRFVERGRRLHEPATEPKGRGCK
jgi:hypothetical protein